MNVTFGSRGRKRRKNDIPESITAQVKAALGPHAIVFPPLVKSDQWVVGISENGTHRAIAMGQTLAAALEKARKL